MVDIMGEQYYENGTAKEEVETTKERGGLRMW